MSSTEHRYEHPLNERMRSALRLEYLFNEYRKLEKQPELRREVVLVICDLLSLLSRSENWSELSQDLQREIDTLEQLRTAPLVDTDKLQAFTDTLRSAQKELSTTPTSKIRIPKLLLAIMQRATVPGGLAPADMPAFTNWLTQDAASQHADITEWMSILNRYEKALCQYLKIVRGRAEARDIKIEQGHTVIQCKPRHLLLQIFIPDGKNYYPEVTGGRQRLSIRLRGLTPNIDEYASRASQLRIAFG